MSKTSPLLGLIALLTACAIHLPAQQILSGVWAGGVGNWYGSGSNWACPLNNGTVFSPCPAPANTTNPTLVPNSAYIGGKLNGIPVSGVVTTDAPPTGLLTISLGQNAPGTLNVTAAGAGSMANSVVVDSQGTLNVTGGGSIGAVQGFAVNAGAVLNVVGPGSGVGGRDLTLGGTVNVLNGGVVSGIYTDLTGSINIDGQGSLVEGIFGALQIDGNITLSNGGAITAANYSYLNPGASLTFDIGGLSNYGTATLPGQLNGTVIFNFDNGFAPMAGDSFHLFNTPENTASATFEIQGLQPGFQYQLVDTPSGLTLDALNNGVNAAPEPTSLFLLPLAALVLFCFKVVR